MLAKLSVDCLVFDVDGVLLDTRHSFPALIRKVVRLEWERMGGEADNSGCPDTLHRVFKRHGAFNDDYDLAWTLLSMALATGERRLSKALPTPEQLKTRIGDCGGDSVEWTYQLFGSRVDRGQIRSLCVELYYGEMSSPGLYLEEKVMLPLHWTALSMPTAIYTGRDLREWRSAQRLLHWEDFPDDRVVHADSGVRKPSPKGFEILCARMGCASPLFFGDTASDREAHAAFGQGEFVAIGDLLPETPLCFADPLSALSSLLGETFIVPIKGE